MSNIFVKLILDSLFLLYDRKRSVIYLFYPI